MDTSGGEVGDKGSLSRFHGDLGIPINFHEVSNLLRFWSLELHEPLEVSSDVRPPVQMRRETSVTSRISTQDSDISSSCQIKEYPAFKPLQGNPALFLVRESRYPLNLRQQNQGPLTYLLLRKAPLEVLVESCLTCSIESWESAFFLTWYGLNRAFIDFLCWNWCS